MIEVCGKRGGLSVNVSKIHEISSNIDRLVLILFGCESHTRHVLPVITSPGTSRSSECNGRSGSKLPFALSFSILCFLFAGIPLVELTDRD